MTARRARLIAKLVWWAAGAPDVLIAAALVLVGGPEFRQSKLVLSQSWKRLAKLLRAKLQLARSEARMAKADVKIARDDAKRWKERWLTVTEKNPVDSKIQSD